MIPNRFERARNFIRKNARLLDRQIFAYLFASGSRQAVVMALKAYQNPDGGFGQALEPDKRCPESQPVDVEMALKILDLVSALDDKQVQVEMILPTCDFLQSISTGEGGVPFALPSAKEYPHAPWWAVEDDPPASLNPTAGIVGLLLKYGIQHPWLDVAVGYCWRAIEASQTEMFHDLMPMIAFLENAPEHARAQRELSRIAERIARPGVVEMDPQAGGYVKMPLDWAPTPESFCRKLFDERTLNQHLVALAQRQRPDGGWPINWDPISPGVELEWRGWVTIGALFTLQAYQEAGLKVPA